MKSGVLENIQMLRAVAAMLVVAVHARHVMPKEMSSLFEWGHAGVDIFFVISGFIMVYVTRPDVTPQDFMKNRLVRVVPLYYAVTFFTVFVAMSAPAIMKATEVDMVQVLKSLLFVPFEKSNGQIHPIVFVGWTINYEMMFYIIFSLSLFFRQSFFVTVLAICSLVFLGVFVRADSVVAKFYTDPIMLEFCAGMLVAKFSRRVGVPLSLFLVIAGFGLIIFSSGWEDFDRTVKYGIPAAMILYGLLSLEEGGVKIGFGKTLGDASYSIYLTHFFVTRAFSAFSSLLSVSGFLSVFVFFASLAASAFVGVVVHFWVEKPFTHAMRRVVFGRRRQVSR